MTKNSSKAGVLTRIRAWLLGVDAEKYLSIRRLLNGYGGSKSPGNSVIMGGPTAWQWYASIDDAHHGNRGAGLHADSHARQHALDSAADHTGTISDAMHGSRGAGLHADSHARQHGMDSAQDHGAGTVGDLIRAIAGGAWARLGIGSAGQLLTVVGGLPAWSDAPAVAEHGNDRHNPDFYPLDGTERLTAPLTMHLMPPASEPGAVAGNEGKLYYLTPGAGVKGIIKQVMLNSTGAFELVQIAVST
ncbi:MAG: hypothetical protein PHU08_02400 [Dehalococcoidales bacterium]|nr:hypothetical protein [Dehalococcoidales bacterium]